MFRQQTEKWENIIDKTHNIQHTLTFPSLTFLF